MKKEIELEDIIEYFEKMAAECPPEGTNIDKYFLVHTANCLRQIANKNKMKEEEQL